MLHCASDGVVCKSFLLRKENWKRLFTGTKVVHCAQRAMVGKLKWTAVYAGRWQHPPPLPPYFLTTFYSGLTKSTAEEKLKFHVLLW